MIKQRFKLDKYSWKVYVYYDVTSEDIYDIIKNIKQINLPNSYVKEAYTILNKTVFNNGVIYTNTRYKSSIIIITKTTNASQFVNTLYHEIYHLVNHIIKTYNIDYDSEEPCYLTGEIVQKMYKACHTLMCDCCRNE